MAPSATATEHNPAFLSALVDRFDPDAIDLPGRSARIRLAVDGADAWDALLSRSGAQLAAADGSAPDALLRADGATWRRISGDVRGGMEAFRRGRLSVRQSLHLGVGFLAATSGSSAPERLRFDSVRTRAGRLSILAAGSGEEVLCLHGLGGTKASFLPTVAALADRYRVIALDLPGFGESAKPFGAPYDARYLARAVVALLDELELESAHLIGNSMGGRVAIEVGLLEPARVRRLVLLCPALAWLRDRRWRWPLRLLRPELGVLQPTPRRLVEPAVRRLVGGGADTWTAAGVDEFLRSYLSPRGRAAFYAAARNIYLDEPRGERGLWTRLAGLSPETMFVWGRRDPLVPIAFMRHVEETLPAARHLELDCGHVPQLEAPRETHAAIASFLGGT
jgi:pimeloyl-ACP methyl ester carboxylesterase